MSKDCKHEWERKPDGDACKHCGASWADTMRGFGSNVQPPGDKKKVVRAGEGYRGW